MLKQIIQTGILAFAGVLLISSYSQASPMAGDEVSLDFGTYHKANFSGGEFLLESTGSTASDYAFTTFCLEKYEYFTAKSWNANATYTIESVTDYAYNNRPDKYGSQREDYISDATKWLMNEYIFNYEDLKVEFDIDTIVEAKDFSQDVQNAIWFFEEEIGTNNYLSDYVLDLGYTIGYDSSFLNNVKVVNLIKYDNQGNIIEYNQSQLIANPVPEPATMLLFGSGLVGLAAIGRKKIRK